MRARSDRRAVIDTLFNTTVPGNHIDIGPLFCSRRTIAFEEPHGLYCYYTLLESRRTVVLLQGNYLCSQRTTKLVMGSHTYMLKGGPLLYSCGTIYAFDEPPELIPGNHIDMLLVQRTIVILKETSSYHIMERTHVRRRPYQLRQELLQ